MHTHSPRYTLSNHVGNILVMLCPDLGPLSSFFREAFRVNYMSTAVSKPELQLKLANNCAQLSRLWNPSPNKFVAKKIKFVRNIHDLLGDLIIYNNVYLGFERSSENEVYTIMGSKK